MGKDKDGKGRKRPLPNPDMEAADMMEPVLFGEMTGAVPFFVPGLGVDDYGDLLDGTAADEDADPEDEMRE